jgi:F0F1-type ATP synthase assembly protein I
MKDKDIIKVIKNFYFLLIIQSFLLFIIASFTIIIDWSDGYKLFGKIAIFFYTVYFFYTIIKFRRKTK